MEEHFAGAWKLAVYELSSSDGESTFPYGKNPSGILMYDRLGNMAVQIMRPGITPFAINDRWMGTTDEMKTAFEGYIAYYGRYAVDVKKGTVTHHVAGSVFPNYIGRKLIRMFEFIDDNLVLSTPSMDFGGSAGIGRLTWVRL
jgi:hypothetical protein